MKRLLLITVILIIGIAAGILAQRYWLPLQDMMPGMGTAMNKTPVPLTSEKKPLYYRHPMTPTITADRPLQDEMGMDYIPIFADEQGSTPGSARPGDAPGTVSISPSVINNMGVRTASVQQGPLSKRINTVGYVNVNEDRLHHVHLRTEGWVENLAVKFTGARVRKGELLFELYAPKLVNAQEEFVQATSLDNRPLLLASRARLRTLGVPDGLIERLEKTRKVEQRVKNYAPQDGVVMALNIREGMYVEPATEAMSLVDLSSVWVMADIFEAQAAWVKLGQRAEMRLAAQPGQRWTGKVDYIYPSLDPVTRTLKVRLLVPNPGEALKPNMFTDVTLFSDAKLEFLSVPREAVIRTGEAERVIMALGGGRFAPREVKTGIEAGERIEILDGLVQGDQVVISGQFLIDSESSLAASLTRMTAEAGMSDAMTKDIPAGQTQAASGIGVVKIVKDGMLNISHEPIASMDWPAMTMDFQLADPALAKEIKPGDQIEFEFSADKNGAFVIKSLKTRVE